MSPWTVERIPNLTGRVAIVTGANSGIGLETTRSLAAAGASVILACRDRDRGERARAELDAEGGSAGETVVGVVDLAVPASIATFAEWFLGSFDRLDLLINNAGIMAVPPRLTDAGIETQWAVNHLGHFALTGRLLPRILDDDTRVVTVSSLAAAGGDLGRHDPTTLEGYRRWQAYADTKLANQVFALELNHRLAATAGRAISVAAHPGLAATNLAAGIGGPVGTVANAVFGRILPSAAGGALATLRAATDPRVEGGQYYGPSGRRQYRGAPKQLTFVPGAANRALGRRLWSQSIELSGVRYLVGEPV